MRLALFQPDQPGNTGTLLRLAACLGLGVDIIEPCGFPLDDRALRRAAMDYGGLAEVTRHAGWEAFSAARRGRLVLLTTQAAVRHVDFAYAPDDVLLLGRESAGVPPHVHAAADARVRIAMREPARALNVALAAAMVTGEAIRQTGGFAP